MYTLDTDSLICFLRGEGKVGERVLATSPSEVAIPAVTLYEIQLGVSRSMTPEVQRAELEALLRRVELLPFGRREAKASALVKARLEKFPGNMDLVDLFVAGTALGHGATLVTRKVEVFERVHDLRTENWY